VHGVETRTVSESVTLERTNLRISPAVSDALAVSEATQLSLNPLVVRSADAVSVQDVPRMVVNPLPLQRAETITATDVAKVVIPGLVVRKAETLTAVDDLEAQLISPIYLTLFEALTVSEHAIRRVFPTLSASVRDFIAVRDVAQVQRLIGGGIYLQVHDSITVRESRLYAGPPPLAGGSGEADPDVVGISPNPPVDGAVGSDYWEVGA
jgi:hypothetical protein